MFYKLLFISSDGPKLNSFSNLKQKRIYNILSVCTNLFKNHHKSDFNTLLKMLGIYIKQDRLFRAYNLKLPRLYSLHNLGFFCNSLKIDTFQFLMNILQVACYIF